MAQLPSVGGISDSASAAAERLTLNTMTAAEIEAEKAAEPRLATTDGIWWKNGSRMYCLAVGGDGVVVWMKRLIGETVQWTINARFAYGMTSGASGGQILYDALYVGGTSTLYSDRDPPFPGTGGMLCVVSDINSGCVVGAQGNANQLIYAGYDADGNLIYSVDAAGNLKTAGLLRRGRTVSAIEGNQAALSVAIDELSGWEIAFHVNAAVGDWQYWKLLINGEAATFTSGGTIVRGIGSTLVTTGAGVIGSSSGLVSAVTTGVIRINDPLHGKKRMLHTDSVNDANDESWSVNHRLDDTATVITSIGITGSGTTPLAAGSFLKASRLADT